MTFPAPVPEIPAAHVDKAAAYYVKTLGFTFDWGDDQGGIAGISRGNCRLFITNRSFRESYGNVGPILFLAQSRQQGCGGRTFRRVEDRAGEDRFRARGQTMEAARVYGRRS